MLFQESIAIAASPNRVWKFVGSPERWGQFDAKVEGCELVSSQGGRIGSVYTVIRRMDAKTTPTRCEIVNLQHGKRIEVSEEAVDPNGPVSSAVFTYELNDLGTSTKVTARAEISFPRMNILLKALVWFISRFGRPNGETPLIKLRRIVEAEESLRQVGPAMTGVQGEANAVERGALPRQVEPAGNIVRDNNGGFKFVDFPFWIGAFAFPLSLFFLCKFAVSLSHGGELQKGYGPLAGALIFGLVGALFTKRTVFEFDVLRRQVVWSKTGVFGRKCGVLPFEKIRNAKVEQSSVGASPSYRASLATDEGILPLTDAYSVGAASQERCQRISDMINNLDIGAASNNDRRNR